MNSLIVMDMNPWKLAFKKPPSDHIDQKNRRVVEVGHNRKAARAAEIATRRNLTSGEPDEVVGSLNRTFTVINEKEPPATEHTKKHVVVNERLQKWKVERQKQKLESLKKTRPPFRVGIALQSYAAGSSVTRVGAPKSMQKSLPVTKPFDFSASQTVLRPMPQITRAAAATIVGFSGQANSVPASAKAQAAQSSSTPKNLPNVKDKKVASVKVPVEVKSLPTIETPSLKAAQRVSRNKASAQEPEKAEPLSVKGTLPTSVGRKLDINAAVAATTQKKEIYEEVMPDEANMVKVCDCSYFRRILAKTVTDLEDQFQNWKHEHECSNQMTEVARKQLLLATGIVIMMRLLIREKFAQFVQLIEDCEANYTEAKTSHLQGFWDMIYLQVLDFSEKLKALEDMKKNNWSPLATPMRDRVVQKEK